MTHHNEETKAEPKKEEVEEVEEVEEAHVEPIHPSEQRGGKKKSLLDTCK
ncbi:MAG: hypothetical protein ACYDEF_10120 [Methanosarcina sp.]